MNSCSSIEREDEGHLNELADSFPSYFRRVETHAIERFADGGLEEKVVRADKPYARGFHPPGGARPPCLSVTCRSTCSAENGSVDPAMPAESVLTTVASPPTASVPSCDGVRGVRSIGGSTTSMRRRSIVGSAGFVADGGDCSRGVLSGEAGGAGGGSTHRTISRGGLSSTRACAVATTAIAIALE
jgi:hypothetical protein